MRLNRTMAPRGPADEVITAQDYPRVPPGEYVAYCKSSEYGNSFGGQRKLFLSMLIHEGEYAGTKLFLACNADKSSLKPNCKLFDLWCIALGRALKKGERFNKDIFVKRLFRVRVRDTKRLVSGTSSPRPDYAQYSVVDTILESVTGANQEGE